MEKFFARQIAKTGPKEVLNFKRPISFREIEFII
jgi:hypothetical protein